MQLILKLVEEERVPAMQQRLLQANTVSPFLGTYKISRKGMKSNAKDNAANITSINKRQGPNICSTVLRYQRADIALLTSDELSLILQACCLHHHVQACSISSGSALTGGTRRELCVRWIEAAAL